MGPETFNFTTLFTSFHSQLLEGISFVQNITEETAFYVQSIHSIRTAKYSQAGCKGASVNN